MSPSTDTRRRIPDSAHELIFTRSCADVGIAKGCADARVSKGGFHHFFARKQARRLPAMPELRIAATAAPNAAPDDT